MLVTQTGDDSLQSDRSDSDLRLTWTSDVPEFQSSRWLKGGHAQTIIGSLLPVPVFAPERSIRIPLRDGDSLMLHQNLPKSLRTDQHGRPIILLSVHGLGGCHRSGYVRRLGSLAHSLGWGSYRMDMRGAGESGRGSKFLYHAGRSDDLLQSVQWIKQQHPDSALVVCGFSLGASITLHLMSHFAQQVESLVDAALVIAPPLDLQACSLNLRRLQNRLYDRNFSKLLWQTLQQRPQVLDTFKSVLPERPPRNLFQFDDLVTAPLGGYQSANDYYQRFSTASRLNEIGRPTLVIASQDDPLIPYSSFAQVQDASALTLLTTVAGGHLGYVARKSVVQQLDDRLAAWSPDPIQVAPNRWLERTMALFIAQRLDPRPK